MSCLEDNCNGMFECHANDFSGHQGVGGG
jgi:hypothetical protein